jgi:hypothetical protein
VGNDCVCAKVVKGHADKETVQKIAGMIASLDTPGKGIKPSRSTSIRLDAPPAAKKAAGAEAEKTASTAKTGITTP